MWFKYTSNSKRWKEYLESTEYEINKLIEEYGIECQKRKFGIKEILSIASYRRPELWQRLPSHKDFLSIRLGYGYFPVPIPVEYPRKNYFEGTDKCLDVFKRRVSEKLENRDAIESMIFHDLKHEKILAVTSNQKFFSKSFDLIIGAMILDLAVFQAPEDLLICLAISNPDLLWV